MTPRHLAAALLLLVPSIAAASANLRPALRSTERYGETFTFVSDLEDGSYVQVQLAVTNLGPGSATGLCRALVVRPGHAPWAQDERIARDEWSWKGGAGETLRIGGCTATATSGSTRVAAAFGAQRVELVLPPISPMVPPGARITAGSSAYQTRILIPGGAVQATVQLERDAQPRTLTGGAYADQSRSDVAPADLARSWVRFRALRGERPLLLLGRQAPDGHVEPIWSLAGRTFRSLQGYELERSGEGSTRGFQVQLDGGGSGNIRSEALLYRHAPVESLGFLGKAIAPLVGSPVTFTYRAVLRREGQPDLPGILEVSLAEE